MKRNILGLFLFMLVAIGANAQSAWGFKAGLNYTGSTVSNIPEELSSIYDARGKGSTGFHAGVFARFGKGFYLQPEAIFTRMQSTIELENSSTMTTEDVKVVQNRLDVPLLLGFKVFELLRFNAGPVASFNLGSAVTAESYEKVEMNSSSFGYQMGLGLDIKMLSFDLRYEGAFGENEINLLHAAGVPQDFNFDNRSSQILFSIGLNF